MRAMVAVLLLVAMLAWAAPAVANPVARFVFDRSNHWQVPVLTNFRIGSVRLQPLFDLGANALHVTSGTLARLGVEPFLTAPAWGAGGASYRLPAGAVELSAPGTSRTLMLDVLANDTLLAGNEVYDSIFPRQLVRTDNLYFLTSRNELYLFDSPCDDLPFADKPLWQLPGAVVLPLARTAAGLLVPVTVGSVSGFLLVDTGASHTSFDARLITRNPGLFSPAGEAGKVTDSSGGSYTATPYYIERGVALEVLSGSLTLSGRVVLAEPQAAGVAEGGMLNPIGSLGMDVLGAYDWAVNFPHGVLTLWPPESSVELFSGTATSQ
jgi:hypothetical protein